MVEGGDVLEEVGLGGVAGGEAGDEGGGVVDVDDVGVAGVVHGGGEGGVAAA